MAVPQISIGLPVYNGENYLSEAIEAVLNQTMADFELIISDNGSTDGTAAICREYADADDRVRYFRYDENLGATWNYNNAFYLARGQYFRWAAHDDLCAPTHLEKCLAVLEQDQDVVLSFPQTVIIDAYGKPIEHYPNRYTLTASAAHQRLRGSLRSSSLCNPVFGLMPRHVLAKTALIQSFPASDRVLLSSLSLYGKFVEVPEPLFYRRMHPETSVSANVDLSQRVSWFDTRRKHGLRFPRSRIVRAYFEAVAQSQISPGEKLQSHGVLLNRFLLHPGWLLTDLKLMFMGKTTGGAWVPSTQPQQRNGKGHA